MRITYNSPAMQVIRIHQADVIATSVATINSNSGINLGGPGHGRVRAPGNRIWE